MAKRRQRMPPKDDYYSLATIVCVIDGDTVELKTGERVRLIGMDAPEQKQLYSTRATKRLEDMLEGHEDVVLERDIRNLDCYERLLRYIWIEDRVYDGKFMRLMKDMMLSEKVEKMYSANLRMVWDGLAKNKAVTPDIRYADLLLHAKRVAKKRKLGMWRFPSWAKFGAIKKNGLYHPVDSPKLDGLTSSQVVLYKSYRKAEREGYRPAGEGKS